MKKYILLLVLVLFFPILFHVFARDASAYAYMGTLFFEGKIPYVDGWDHKGISLYLINALGYLIGFKNYVGIRILELLLIAFSFLNIYKTLSIKYSKKIAFIAVSFGLLSLKYFFDGGNLTEEYGAIFVLLSLSLLLKKEHRTLDYLIIGFLFIINFTIRANLISFWIAMFFAFILFYLFKKKEFQKLIIIFLKIGLGIVIGCSFLAIYFLLTNSFNDFYNAAFTYNFSYAKQSLVATIGSIIKSTRTYEVSLIMIFGLLIAFISVIRKRISFIAVLLLCWIPVELYFSNMSGKGYPHYYMMWVPIIIISIAFTVNYFKAELISKEKRFVAILVTSFLFFQIPIFNTIKDYKSLVSSSKNRNEEIATYINKNYSSNSILVWGNESTIYNLTDKRATVTNFYQTLFKLNTPITKKMIINFTSQIQQNPPEVIVDVKTYSLLFLDKSNLEKIDMYQRENLIDFFTFFNNNYQLIESVNGANFYIKNP